MSQLSDRAQKANPAGREPISHDPRPCHMTMILLQLEHGIAGLQESKHRVGNNQ